MLVIATVCSPESGGAVHGQREEKSGGGGWCRVRKFTSGTLIITTLTPSSIKSYQSSNAEAGVDQADFVCSRVANARWKGR